MTSRRGAPRPAHALNHIAFSPDASHFVAATRSGISVYSTDNARTVYTAPLGAGQGAALAHFCGNSNLLLYVPAETPNAVVLWDAANSCKVFQISFDTGNAVLDIACNFPSFRFLVVLPGEVKIYSLEPTPRCLYSAKIDLKRPPSKEDVLAASRTNLFRNSKYSTPNSPYSSASSSLSNASAPQTTAPSPEAAKNNNNVQRQRIAPALPSRPRQVSEPVTASKSISTSTTAPTGGSSIAESTRETSPRSDVRSEDDSSVVPTATNHASTRTMDSANELIIAAPVLDDIEQLDDELDSGLIAGHEQEDLNLDFGIKETDLQQGITLDDEDEVDDGEVGHLELPLGLFMDEDDDDDDVVIQPYKAGESVVIDAGKRNDTSVKTPEDVSFNNIDIGSSDEQIMTKANSNPFHVLSSTQIPVNSKSDPAYIPDSDEESDNDENGENEGEVDEEKADSINDADSEGIEVEDAPANAPTPQARPKSEEGWDDVLGQSKTGQESTMVMNRQTSRSQQQHHRYHQHLPLSIKTRTKYLPFAVSTNSMLIAVACKTPGQVRLLNLDKNTSSIVVAHSSSIRILALSYNGEFLATASEKGTLIRVFDTRKNKLVTEVRRGLDQANIHDISFNPSGTLLCVISEKGTAHVYNISAHREQELINAGQSNQSDSQSQNIPVKITQTLEEEDAGVFTIHNENSTVNIIDGYTGKQPQSMTNPPKGDLNKMASNDSIEYAETTDYAPSNASDVSSYLASISRQTSSLQPGSSQASNGQNKRSFFFGLPLLPKYFSSKWSFAQYSLSSGEVPPISCFRVLKKDEPESLVVTCYDGSWQTLSISSSTSASTPGNDMTLLSYSIFYKPKSREVPIDDQSILTMNDHSKDPIFPEELSNGSGANSGTRRRSNQNSGSAYGKSVNTHRTSIMSGAASGSHANSSELRTSRTSLVSPTVYENVPATTRQIQSSRTDLTSPLQQHQQQQQQQQQQQLYGEREQFQGNAQNKTSRAGSLGSVHAQGFDPIDDYETDFSISPLGAATSSRMASSSHDMYSQMNQRAPRHEPVARSTGSGNSNTFAQAQQRSQMRRGSQQPQQPTHNRGGNDDDEFDII